MGDLFCDMSATGKTGSDAFEPKQCPAGYEIDWSNISGPCVKVDPASCPSGQTLRMLGGTESHIGPVCVPNNVTTTPFPPGSGRDKWPCKQGEFADEIGGVCVPPPGTVTPSSGRSTTGGSSVDTPPPGSPTPPPAAPRAPQTYDKEIAEYEAAISRALSTNDGSKLPEIRTLADRAMASLNKRIEELTYLKTNTPDIRMERDHLLAVLRRIQTDYSALITNTDDLETLRRIREQEGGAAKKELMWYMIAFLVAALALMAVIFVMGGQKALATAISPITPAMSPPLM